MHHDTQCVCTYLFRARMAGQVRRMRPSLGSPGEGGSRGTPLASSCGPNPTSSPYQTPKSRFTSASIHFGHCGRCMYLYCVREHVVCAFLLHSTQRSLPPPPPPLSPPSLCAGVVRWLFYCSTLKEPLTTSPQSRTVPLSLPSAPCSLLYKSVPSNMHE